MSPIRPENRARYPKDWPAISKAIKDRAGWRCECAGECGSKGHTWWLRLCNVGAEPERRCPNLHGKPSEFTGSIVVLTTAHLDHTPEHCEDANLKAMCQGCHLAYDSDHHAETRAASKAAATAPLDVDVPLFEESC